MFALEGVALIGALLSAFGAGVVTGVGSAEGEMVGGSEGVDPESRVKKNFSLGLKIIKQARNKGRQFLD